MHPATRTDGRREFLAVAVLGTDAVLAGLPATAVQLAHACQRAGYDLVIPASWGDELVAAECLRALDQRGPRPVVLCACPHVRRELLGVGPDLAPVLIPVVPPPVATARYLRALVGERQLVITYIGDCPGADHPEIEARIAPTDFLAMLDRQGIVPADEPSVFDSVIPPDRRRYFSIPGGVPAPEHLWGTTHARALVELDDEPLFVNVAQRLLSRECALIDVAPTLGCVCSGVAAGIPAFRGRAMAAASEPPRATSTVIDVGVTVELAHPIGPADFRDLAAPARPSPARGDSVPAVADEAGARSPDRRRRSPPAGVRAIRSAIPLARIAGRALPRAYFFRRRLTDQTNVETTPAPTESPAPNDRSPGQVADGNGRFRSRSRRESRKKSESTARPPTIAASSPRPGKHADGS